MATVHYGRQHGSAGFARIVAIKRLHPHLGKDEDFRAMFLDEARIAARIQHPNVASILDVVSLPEGELMIVMEYIAGESLSRLLRRVRDDGELVPVELAVAMVCDVLHGLHAAHEAKNEKGEPLGIIHRDVSPHNILVGADGIARIVDFGIAKARGSIHATREGQVKGKLAYMPPEQLRGKTIDRRCDIYAAGIVLWETLTARRLFSAESEGETVTNVLERSVVPPSQLVDSVPRALDAVVLKALARDPQKRFATARDMAAAIEAAAPAGSVRTVGTWVQTVAADVLKARGDVVAELEQRGERASVSPPDVTPSAQTSSVSVVSDAHNPTVRHTGYFVAAAALLGVVVATLAVKLTHHQQVMPVPAASSPALVETTPLVVAEPPNTTAMSAAPLPTASAPPKRKSTGVPTRRPLTTSATSTAVIPVATAAASEKCPVKTFTDADGIVQFRRICNP